MIDGSDVFTFYLYKKNLTIARHIGILVCLNGKPAFSVDWGDESYVGFNKPPHGFNIEWSGEYIQRIEMTTQEKKNLVKLVIESWQNCMKDKEYDLIMNNCRHFCKIALDIPKKYHPIQKRGREEAMTMLIKATLADGVYLAPAFPLVLSKVIYHVLH